jgi:hypothetical protein
MFLCRPLKNKDIYLASKEQGCGFGGKVLYMVTGEVAPRMIDEKTSYIQRRSICIRDPIQAHLT